MKRRVFNIKANDFRLVCAVDYRTGIVMHLCGQSRASAPKPPNEKAVEQVFRP
jgi:hypothetical protein